MALQPTTPIAVLTTVLLCTAIVIITTATRGDGKRVDEANNRPEVEGMLVEACKNMSSDLLLKREHFDEEHCVSVLRSDKRSLVAKDYGDLAVIAMDLLGHQSNKVMAQIDSILRDQKVQNRTELAFKVCSAYYSSMVRMVPVCHEIFLSLKPLGKKVPCRIPVGDDFDGAYALGCLDGIDKDAWRCGLWLRSYWHDNRIEEFDQVVKHISLAWGLIGMATDCRDNDD